MRILKILGKSARHACLLGVLLTATVLDMEMVRSIYIPLAAAEDAA